MILYKDKEYLKHILDTIEDIESSINNIEKERFLSKIDIKDANIRRLEIIGEAVKNLSKDFKKKYNDIEWNKIAETRDRIIHKYFDIDLDIVWEILKKDIPKLKKQLEKVIR